MNNKHLSELLASQISLCIEDFCYINWDLYNPGLECDTEKLREKIQYELDEIFGFSPKSEEKQ